MATAGVSCADPSFTLPDELGAGADAGSSSFDEDPGPGEYRRSITVGDLEREFAVLVPSRYDPDAAAPLVVDLHSLSITNETQASLSGFRWVAHEQGFIVVWPQGIHNSWNGYDCCGEAHAQGVDDVGFIVAAIEDVAATWNVDRKRVYATGYDAGGALAHRLACERADVIAAAAPVAYGYDVTVQGCAPVRPLSIIQFCGVADSVSCDRGRAEASFEAWAALNSCVGPAVEEGDCRIYEDCQDGVTTTLCAPDANHLDIYQRIDVAGAAWRVFAASRLPRFAVLPRTGE